MSSHRPRESTAAYVLGLLSADERAEFDEHLEQCEQCRHEVVAFAGLPGLLGTIDESDLDLQPLDVADAVVEQTKREYTSLRVSRRRWRFATAAVVVTAVAVLVVVALIGPSNTDNVPGTLPGEELAFQSEFDEVTGIITLSERPWGTLVLLDLFDVPVREEYTMWAVSSSGDWSAVATWAWAEQGTCGIPGATSWTHDEIQQVVVTGADDRGDQIAQGLAVQG